MSEIDLVGFLTDVKLKLEKEELSEEMIQMVTLFYMYWELKQKNEEVTLPEMFRYCVLGMYIYEFLLK